MSPTGPSRPHPLPPPGSSQTSPARRPPPRPVRHAHAWRRRPCLRFPTPPAPNRTGHRPVLPSGRRSMSPTGPSRLRPLPSSSQTSPARRPAPRPIRLTSPWRRRPCLRFPTPPAPNRTGHRPVLPSARRSMSPTGPSRLRPLPGSSQTPPARRPVPRPVRHAHAWRRRPCLRSPAPPAAPSGATGPTPSGAAAAGVMPLSRAR